MVVTGERWLSCVVVSLLLAACGGDEGAAPTTEVAASTETSSIAPSTSASPSTSGVSTTHTQTNTTAAIVPTSATAIEDSGGGGSPLADQCGPDTSPALAAFDIASGEQRWVTCSASVVRRSVVAVTDERAYAIDHGAGTGPSAPTSQLIALGLADGSVSWQVDGIVAFAETPSGPFVGAGVVVLTVDDADGRAVVGVEPATGATRWRTPVDADSAAIAATERFVVVSASTPPEGWVPPTFDPAVPPPGNTTFGFYTGLDRASGAELWSSDATIDLSTGGSGPPSAAVDGDTVILMPGQVALDAGSGAVLARSAADVGDGTLGTMLDGVVLTGGQGDPTTAVDASTGRVLWTNPGSPAYDDVWAVGDGAVYVVDRDAGEMIAYELADGAVRWRRPFDEQRYGWPWHVSGDTLFAAWSNLDALSTVDGSTRWATDFPAAEFPRISGVGTNQTTVVVALSSIPSGGD